MTKKSKQPNKAQKVHATPNKPKASFLLSSA